MSVTTHERPGVYSEYDASSVVQGRQGRKMVGMAAIHATAPAGVPQTVTSYEGALIAFGSTGAGYDRTDPAGTEERGGRRVGGAGGGRGGL